MTALAKLPEKWRATAEVIAKPYGFVTEHTLGKTEALTECADELSAALSARASAGEGGVALRDALRCVLDIAARRTLLPSEVTHWEALLVTPFPTAAPQPAQAGASGGGDVDQLIARVDKVADDLLDPNDCSSSWELAEELYNVCADLRSTLTPASPATGDAATWEEEIRRHDATPPAHGDGEGLPDELVSAWDAIDDVTFGNPPRYAKDVIAPYLTTRPSPEGADARGAALRMRLSDLTGVAHGYAQELAAVKAENAYLKQDAARYRWLRKQNANLDNPGAWTITCCDFTAEEGPSRYWVGSDLDAAIDAALALPAQGEGKA